MSTINGLPGDLYLGNHNDFHVDLGVSALEHAQLYARDILWLHHRSVEVTITYMRYAREQVFRYEKP